MRQYRIDFQSISVSWGQNIVLTSLPSSKNGKYSVSIFCIGKVKIDQSKKFLSKFSKRYHSLAKDTPKDKFSNCPDFGFCDTKETVARSSSTISISTYGANVPAVKL
jgi:hypothetical protein